MASTRHFSGARLVYVCLRACVRARACVCVCVRACARACVCERVRVRACESACVRVRMCECCATKKNSTWLATFVKRHQTWPTCNQCVREPGPERSYRINTREVISARKTSHKRSKDPSRRRQLSRGCLRVRDREGGLGWGWGWGDCALFAVPGVVPVQEGTGARQGLRINSMVTYLRQKHITEITFT